MSCVVRRVRGYQGSLLRRSPEETSTQTPSDLSIPDILCQTSPMKRLTAILCLTLAVLLGSAGEGFALPECDGSPNTGSASAVRSWDNCRGTHSFDSNSKYAGFKYVGEWINGKPNGHGTATWNAPHKIAGEKYVGEYKNGKKHGHGTTTWNAPHKIAGSKYVGEFKNDKKYGQGTFTFFNGDKFVGEFRDGKKHGQGTYSFADGRKYVGEFRDNKYDGRGTFAWANGRIEEGIWKDGKFQYAQIVTPPVIARKTPPPPPSPTVTAEKTPAPSSGDFRKENERLRIENERLKEQKKPLPTVTAEKPKPKVDQQQLLRLARRTQEALQVLGLYSGKLDGIIGVKTRSAIQQWQKRNGYSGTGEVTEAQLAKLEQEAITRLAEKKPKPKVAEKKEQPPPPSTGTGTSGSGFFVSKQGHVLTNEHVVRKCNRVTVGDNANRQVPVAVLETDRRNDLALLKLSSTSMASAETKSLISKLGIRIVSKSGDSAVPLSSNGLLRSDDVELGEDVLVSGFPYGDIFSNTIKVTKGIVSAIRGMGDDSGQFQMDAAVQAGNSGGPIYDGNGNIVGVVISQLNRLKVAKTLGSLPELVNFGIKASTVRQFLTSAGLPTRWSERSKSMSTKELAKIAKNQTVMVVCTR
jgi:S1-C subfamily serine protease